MLKNSRRFFLKQVSTVAGATPLTQAWTGGLGAVAAATSTLVPTNASAETDCKDGINSSYVSFGPVEANFIEALVNIMCPADDLTPNGVDCGLATYIDRRIAGGLGKGHRLYRQGPWEQGKPQTGYQLPLTPEQYFNHGIREVNLVCQKNYKANFDEIAEADANNLLTDIAAGKVNSPDFLLNAWFNDLIYPLFVEACFSDPMYGGNKSKIFWRAVGYPGLPASYHQDMITYRGKEYPGSKNPKSIGDFS